MQIDPVALGPQASYKLITGTVVPRPIAWVCSGPESGRTNLAPFSTFTFLSSFPPIVGFNCGRRGGRQKDTSRNINAYREYVINIADESLLHELHQSSQDFPPEVSEIDALGLATAPSRVVRTPRLARAPISMECRLQQTLSFGNTGAEFFVGEVVMFHVRDDLYFDGKIDTRKLRPICRLAGPHYAALGEIISMGPAGTLPG
jgi:flavin reductase (DIM6/NTAB) family NADH-FMN oxidoreductase RutF